LFGCNPLNVWQWQWESWIPQIGGTLYWVSDVWTHFCLFFFVAFCIYPFFSKISISSKQFVLSISCKQFGWVSLECVLEFLEGL
jgi:hypothetical protein